MTVQILVDAQILPREGLQRHDDGLVISYSDPKQKTRTGSFNASEIDEESKTKRWAGEMGASV
jgi:hypothetical protein